MDEPNFSEAEKKLNVESNPTLPIPDELKNSPGTNVGSRTDDFLNTVVEDPEFSKERRSMPRDLRNDQISPEEAFKAFPGLRDIKATEKPMPSNTGNKIGTSNQNNKMANGSGAQQLSDYLNTMGNVRNITPQFRPRSMVDVELDRGGRISPLIAVRQHRDSPHMGYTNDFAGAP